jgi:hypothetical protein
LRSSIIVYGYFVVSVFGKPRVCKFDGCYYCYECHENEEYYIPTRIVHNWDFRKHKGFYIGPGFSLKGNTGY